MNRPKQEDYDIPGTADSESDLFRDNLSQTIKQYEHLLFIDNFKDDGERNMTQTLLDTMKK